MLIKNVFASKKMILKNPELSWKKLLLAFTAIGGKFTLDTLCKNFIIKKTNAACFVHIYYTPSQNLFPVLLQVSSLFFLENLSSLFFSLFALLSSSLTARARARSKNPSKVFCCQIGSSVGSYLAETWTSRIQKFKDNSCLSYAWYWVLTIALLFPSKVGRLSQAWILELWITFAPPSSQNVCSMMLFECSSNAGNKCWQSSTISIGRMRTTGNFLTSPHVIITQVLYVLAPTGAPYAATTLHITSPNTSNLNITFSSTSTSKHDFWLEHSVTTDALDYNHTSGTKQHNSRNWWNSTRSLSFNATYATQLNTTWCKTCDKLNNFIFTATASLFNSFTSLTVTAQCTSCLYFLVEQFLPSKKTTGFSRFLSTCFVCQNHPHSIKKGKLTWIVLFNFFFYFLVFAILFMWQLFKKNRRKRQK